MSQPIRTFVWPSEFIFYSHSVCQKSGPFLRSHLGIRGISDGSKAIERRSASASASTSASSSASASAPAATVAVGCAFVVAIGALCVEVLAECYSTYIYKVLSDSLLPFNLFKCKRWPPNPLRRWFSSVQFLQWNNSCIIGVHRNGDDDDPSHSSVFNCI